MIDDWDIESALRRRAVTHTATGISELSEQIEWMAADTIEALRAENAELKKAINGVLWAFENVTMNENSKQLFALRAACAALGYE